MSTEHLMRKALDTLNELDGPLSVEAIHSRIGLLRVDRDPVGNRIYDSAAMRRLVFLTRMRLSGMAIRDLHHYVSLVDAGDGTVDERLDMLLEHRDTIRRQIAELTLSLAATEYKIATYGGRTQP